MPTEQLKSYQKALAQYHLHSKAKCCKGYYLDSGATLRRHILARAVEHIGKEANRWEEQPYLGLKPQYPDTLRRIAERVPLRKLH